MHKASAIDVQKIQIDVLDIQKYLKNSHLVVHQFLFVGFAFEDLFLVC